MCLFIRSFEMTNFIFDLIVCVCACSSLEWKRICIEKIPWYSKSWWFSKRTVHYEVLSVRNKVSWVLFDCNFHCWLLLFLLSLLQHPNLLKCYGGHTKNDNYALVTELMEDNIFNLLNKKNFKIDMPTIIKIAIQAHTHIHNYRLKFVNSK